jgi:hypothetical protein
MGNASSSMMLRLIYFYLFLNLRGGVAGLTRPFFDS